MVESTPIYFHPLYLPIETGRMAEWYNREMVGVCIDTYANNNTNGRVGGDEEIRAYFAAISYEPDNGENGTVIAGPFPTAEDAHEATLHWAEGLENAEVVRD